MAFQYWYQNAVFYEVSVRSFYDGNGDGIGDLAGLIEKLDYLKELGVDCLWLLPIYASPRKDDGYDISDFCSIHPDLGSLDDFERLIAQAHQRGLKIVMDLVMNHTSDEHPWFQAARADKTSPYHDYYVWSQDDQKYAGARIIFLDTERSNWTWNEATGEYYWHRFYTCQPDLNYDNPAVIVEMKEVVRFWLQKGIDGFRVDAVPYLIEREGTSCENLPETHTILKELRQFLDEQSSDKVLICEANQWPQDVYAYFGGGSEFHMAFNFPIMPRMYMALKQSDATPIRWALEQLPQIPADCQWGSFLRNHDELTLEMVSNEERRFMWESYSPQPGQRINLGIRRRLTPLLDNDRRKLELMNVLLFSLPGSPFIYYGDEIGMGDDISLFDRNGLRTPMQWSDARNAGFTEAEKPYLPIIHQAPYAPDEVNVAAQMNDEASLWQFNRHLIELRKAHPALASHSLEWIETGSTAIAAFWRSDDKEQILAAFNLSDQTLDFTLSLPANLATRYTDLFKGYSASSDWVVTQFTLSPYGYLWLSFTK